MSRNKKREEYMLKLKTQILTSIALIVLLAFQPNAAYAVSSSDTTFKRMQGADRYATALQISKEGWQSSENVILATGESFPDALSSAPLAKLMNSPILLTPKDSLNVEVINEIRRLGVKKAYIIGGQGVISSYIETTLKSMNIEVDRTYGSDRYDTSVAVAIKFFKTENEAVVVTGENFPDAISIASAAAAKKIPILLTKGDTLSANIKNYIKSARITVTYIAGDSSVVSSDIENQLPNPKRLGGSDRYATNTAILNYFSDILKSSTTYIATGEDYPDALAGSVLAARNLSPILLVSDKPKQSTLNFISDKKLTSDNMHILGGNGAVSNSSVNLLLSSRSSANIPLPAQLPPAQLIKGIDVSRWQCEIDWDDVKDAAINLR
jgi:putative cell wall-binding protein